MQTNGQTTEVMVFSKKSNPKDKSKFLSGEILKHANSIQISWKHHNICCEEYSTCQVQDCSCQSSIHRNESCIDRAQETISVEILNS